MLHTKVCVLLLAVLGLSLTFMSCTSAPQPTTTPVILATPAAPATLITPTASATSESLGIEQPNWWGTATDSVEMRIYQSDVIVRANLLSTGDGHLRFRAVEYLKGSGASEFVVDASAAQRNTAWDGQEAILFLTTPDAGGASGSSGNSPPARFQFTKPLIEPYKGDLPEGYSVDRRNPVWLPQAQSNSGASGQSGGDPTFITDAGPLSGTGDAPTITLTDLKAKIAWIDGGEEVTGYDQCIRTSLSSLGWHRDFETFFGSPWEPPQHSMEIGSGLAEGTQATGYGTGWPLRLPQYNQYWLSGKNASLFVALIVDDDEDPSNGFYDNAFTTRPLPNGTYEFTYHSRFFDYLPCDFHPQSGRADWALTVTASGGTVHEAFFDPVGSGDAVGYLGTGDALKPTTFSKGEARTTIQSLKWQDSTVTLELSTYNALTGHTLDFITGDGTTILSLEANAATGDSTAGTLSWAAGSQPWSSGDQLMLRIRKPNGPPVFGQDSYGFSAAESASTFTIIGTVSATDEDDDSLAYHIISGNGGGDFNIDLNEGFILVRKKLDYETTTSYELMVEARDGKGGKDSTTVAIEVTDVAE